MGIRAEPKVNVGVFSEGQRVFLEYHRENVLRMSRRRGAVLDRGFWPFPS